MYFMIFYYINIKKRFMANIIITSGVRNFLPSTVTKIPMKYQNWMNKIHLQDFFINYVILYSYFGSKTVNFTYLQILVNLQLS